jgi:hypothetical protein
VRFAVPFGSTVVRKLQHRKADPGVLLGEADFPTTNPKPAFTGRGERFSTESLILAQDERWRRA